MTPAEHRQKSQHNEEFIDTVFGDYIRNPTAFLDWVTTAIFYAALHKVDEYLTSLTNPIRPGEHSERDRLVQTVPDLRVIQKEYRWLKDRSRDARYSLRVFNATDVRNWRSNKLGRIKVHLDRRIQALTT